MFAFIYLTDEICEYENDANNISGIARPYKKVLLSIDVLVEML